MQSAWQRLHIWSSVAEPASSSPDRGGIRDPRRADAQSSLALGPLQLVRQSTSPLPRRPTHCEICATQHFPSSRVPTLSTHHCVPCCFVSPAPAQTALP